MIIHPYSDTTKFASGGIWEPTAANFPACKHFFNCNDALLAVSTTLTDSIGGIVLTGASLSAIDSGGGNLALGGAANQIQSGAWQNPLTKNILLMWGGVPGSSGSSIIVGSVTASTNRGFRNSAVAATLPAVVGEGATSVITGTGGLAGTGSQWQARAMTITWDSTTGIAPYDWDGTTWTARAAAGDLNTVDQTGITTMDASVNFGALSAPGFIQVFYFTTLPSAAEIKSALLWTTAMASTAPYGKYIYPGFKGRS